MFNQGMHLAMSGCIWVVTIGGVYVCVCVYAAYGKQCSGSYEIPHRQQRVTQPKSNTVEPLSHRGSAPPHPIPSGSLEL